MEKFKRFFHVFVVCSLLITGGIAVGAETASAKEVIKTSDQKKNKITGKYGNAFNYVYFNVPSSAYLCTRTEVKIDTGIINDTYRSYWIYYSSSTGKYYLNTSLQVPLSKMAVALDYNLKIIVI
ncbi:hypothetical protein MUB24_17225 [Lederbergia sp. NSJ-179]|uniref:hypothetical protein n=1 Tax=Lederbergia sp. NSJ-179 TaxID=2931402 RepID=UPI001FD190B1|nr:hypothetical protein [Lederbergia sp. NSJ-179]MCJ7842607.1 hypothetical protein [Lederbergia sp. NSJ-179]